MTRYLLVSRIKCGHISQIFKMFPWENLLHILKQKLKYIKIVHFVVLGLFYGVQRRMISVDIFFIFLRLLFFALLLLYLT